MIEYREVSYSDLWPSARVLDLPPGSPWICLKESPSSHLFLYRERDSTPEPLIVGVPKKIDPAGRYLVSARAHANEHVTTPTAAGLVLTWRTRRIRIALSSEPSPGGDMRFQFRLSGNTASIGSSWVFRVATRYLVSLHARVRESGDTVNCGLYGIDEDGAVSDSSDFIPGTAPNVGNNVGFGLGAASDHTVIYNAGTYMHENLADHMGLLISSTYSAGASLRVSVHGRVAASVVTRG